MPHQVALTIIAEVKPGQVEELKRLLRSLDDRGPAGDGLPFEQLDMVHFARFFVLDEIDETKDPAGDRIPAQLVFLTDLDAPLYRYLSRLGALAGAALDEVYRHCEGYPEHVTAAGRLAYLRSRTISAAAFYVNTVGRSVRQIRQEARLRDAIQAFLDRSDQGWASRSAPEIRAAVQAFVRADKELSWALEPARPPSLLWRIKDKLHLAAGVLLLLVLSPLMVLAAPFFLVTLRRHERNDQTPRITLDKARADELAELEDHVVQNPLSAVGYVKPGRFRLLTVTGVLRLVDFGVRHIFNHGSLAGITTIHFARWVFVDDRRRIFFASSYDGSLESYMDDFIDKVWWGLNAVFSNGAGYPRTRWLLWDGARDEQAFKRFLRSGQVVTQFWYSAYDHLTAINIANNAAIRAGLSGSMSSEEVRRWLRRL
jgi:hypothetical protein